MFDKKWLVVLAAALAFFQPAQLTAASRSSESGETDGACKCDRTLEQIVDEWEIRRRNRASEAQSYEYKEVSTSDNEEADAQEELPRFIEIYRDESFIYSMDRKTARIRSVPHMAREKMIDVWIKLEPLEFLENDYTYPSKYYLEHYLLRPKKQQYQFLAEMEVKGRPTGETPNRTYDGRLWESLIPGSIEDAVYHAVMEYKSEIYDETTANGTGIRDFIENTINVSL